jgi:hypothetical protein
MLTLNHETIEHTQCGPVWDAAISRELFLVEIWERMSISKNVLYGSNLDRSTFDRT